MGERKGVNKYYPPDFDYKKHGSLDRYHNSHPLRERAKKISEGILIIRFEMPYNIWCNGCNKHIGMGVRYNSEKKKVGNYYSTIIYKFRMKCHLCDQYFEIQTDPANSDYKILSGARRKEERWDAKSNEQIEMTDREVKKQLNSDPMFKLEHEAKDHKKLEKVIPTLEEIQDIQDEKLDDYLLNKELRRTFREQKKKLERDANNDNKLLQKSSLNIELLPETEEDVKMAQLLKYQTVKFTKQNEVRKDIDHKPILEVTPKSKFQTTFQNLAAKLPKTLTTALKPKMPSTLWRSSNKDMPKAQIPKQLNGVKLVRKKKPIALGKQQKQNLKLAAKSNDLEKSFPAYIAASSKSFAAPDCTNKLQKISSLVAYSSDLSSENSDNQDSDVS